MDSIRNGKTLPHNTLKPSPKQRTNQIQLETLFKAKQQISNSDDESQFSLPENNDI